MSDLTTSGAGPVHLVNYASQPDLQIWCDGSWTTPAYGKRQTAQPYETDDGRWYAFDWLEVTCRACLHKLSNGQIELHLRVRNLRRWLQRGRLPPGVMEEDKARQDRLRAAVARWGDPTADLMSVR